MIYSALAVDETMITIIECQRDNENSSSQNGRQNDTIVCDFQGKPVKIVMQVPMVSYYVWLSDVQFDLAILILEGSQNTMVMIVSPRLQISQAYCYFNLSNSYKGKNALDSFFISFQLRSFQDGV